MLLYLFMKNIIFIYKFFIFKMLTTGDNSGILCLEGVSTQKERVLINQKEVARCI